MKIRMREALNKYAPGIPIATVAVRSGIDPSTLHSIVSGAREYPNLQTVEKVCQHLNITDISEVIVLYESSDSESEVN